jgi:dCMP deaminase
VKHKLFAPYMDTARSFAKLSHAKRKQVGAIAITPQDLILYSWNGTAVGDDNNCENADGTTKDETLHAESNLVAKSAREGVSLKGSSIFVTLSPCIQCAKQLLQAGVERVVYDEEYRDLKGLHYLKTHGIIVEKFEENC